VVGVAGCLMTLDEPVVKPRGSGTKPRRTGGELIHHPVRRVFSRDPLGFHILLVQVVITLEPIVCVWRGVMVMS
jgi:hypothetical protein